MIFQKAAELESKKISFVMVTMTKVIASAPQEVGAKCIVTKDGLFAGTVGGGKVEAAAIKLAQEILTSKDKKEPINLEWNLQKDIGMTCGGVVHMMFEHFPASQWKIAIFGAGHVSQALTRALSKLDCRITVIDERDEWADRLEGVEILKTANAKEAVSHFDEDTFFISMTKGHAFDVPFLVEISKQFPNAPYVGAIGSKAKSLVIFKDLREQAVSEEFISKLKTPIGLPFGNNTPEEISISIIAQLLTVRDFIFSNKK